MTTFATLPLSAIVSSLTNPRKTFNQPKLQELADSIKASGVHQPILVRPLPASRVPDTDRAVTHEIISGERRYRACTLAGLTTIPAMVRDMTDDQVLEAQLVENLQRDDLTELEEAEGYDTLRTATSLSVDEVAAKIGKSRSYVFARLKLLDLSHKCKQAMRDGHVDASRALLIARIPDTALQTKALAEAMRKDFRGEVCSVRAFSSWLQANVMLKLENAVFVMADSQLVPAAGSCHVCPKRTGANPDLFADVQATNICTDPVCFHSKEEAHRADVLATAAKRGMRLVEGDEAQEICNRYSSNLIGYSPLTQQREDTADGQAASLGQLLGKDAPAAVLIENPWTKKLIAAVPTEEAEAVLLARGLVRVVQAKQKTADDIEGDIKRLQARVKTETTRRFRKMAFTELATVVHETTDKDASRLICPALLRAWWLRWIDELDTDNLARVFGLALMDVASNDPREILDAKETQIRLHIQACTQAKLYKAFALNLVMEDTPDYFYGEVPEPTLLTALASELDVNLDDIEAIAQDMVRAETAADLSYLKAQLKSQAKPNDITATGYRGPNGETWSGRGLMPRWLTVLVQGGQDKELFRITPPDLPKEPTTGAPVAHATGCGGAKAKVKKSKTSAAEAQAQIAAALAEQERGQGAITGADAQGCDATVMQPVAAVDAVASKASQAENVQAGLAVGQRVRITTDTTELGLIAGQYAGKEGTITRRDAEGGLYWYVSFKGRSGGISLFGEDQIEAVGVGVAA